MTESAPTNLGELLTEIRRDSQVTRDAVKRELDDVKKRLDTFVTKDHFEAEKRLLEARIQHAEEALEKLERDARGRSMNAREFIYKGIIPALALIIAGLALVFGGK
ncbi:hypothetical protein [Streptomyces sp. NPDC088752]|uniref:hypothetical protein n=1 Tax=Streptomyces sp. NPDC088752 TaxID=3154963 RepID=UPI00343C7A24